MMEAEQDLDIPIDLEFPDGRLVPIWPPVRAIPEPSPSHSPATRVALLEQLLERVRRNRRSA